jgi:hypothetical protein
MVSLMLGGAETPVAIPISDLELLDSAFVGAALALRFERFGRGQIVGLELADQSERQRVPIVRAVVARENARSLRLCTRSSA